MTVFERIESMRKSRKISQGKLEKELGFSNGSISKWKTSMPTLERLQKIADYFEVTVDYLTTGHIQDTNDSTNQGRDIANNINDIISNINDSNGRPVYYDGIELDEKSKELAANFFLAMKQQMELVIEMNNKKQQ